MLTKEQRSKLRAAYAEVWPNSEKMTDYCTNKVAVLAELPGGDFIPVDKQSIEKDFCFGESGYDYDDAVRASQHARTSESYFKRENMRVFDSWLSDIDAQYRMHGADPSLPDNVLLIVDRAYISSPAGAKLKSIHLERWHRFMEAQGGSCRVRELPGGVVEIHGNKYRVPTLAELDAIKAAYEEARAEHEKKVDCYLKRYGTSKVNAWTYWRDA